MTNLAELNTLLSIELGDSEIINKTQEQRNLALNQACLQTYEYRKWPEKYVNQTTQAVDNKITIPFDYDIETALYFGRRQRYGGNNIQFINQTDFFADLPQTATVSEFNGEQTIFISQSSFYNTADRGYILKQKLENDKIGINNIITQETIGQTFIAVEDFIEGFVFKLNRVGNPVGSLIVEVYDTVAGLPAGPALKSGTINIRNIKETSEYHWVKLDENLTLTKGLLYAVTIRTNYATSPTDFIEWSYTTDDVLIGNQVIFDGVNWIPGTGDQTFLVASDYFKFQYVKKFIPMVQSTDENGLTPQFNQAIAKMAAGIMFQTKNDDEKAFKKLFGVGGSQQNPTQNSAFGLLDLIWQNVRINSMRQYKRVRTIYDYQNSLIRPYWWRSGPGMY